MRTRLLSAVSRRIRNLDSPAHHTAVFVKNLRFQLLPELVRNRMRNIFVRTVLELATWHTDEQSIFAFDNFKPPDDEDIFECDIHECLQFVLIS